MRHTFALDLKDDPVLIEAYELAHVRIWPEVRDHLLRHGILDMEIYRVANRLFMVMETDDARYDAEAMARAAAEDGAVQAWEAFMGCVQVPISGAPEGVKWAPMRKVFSLRDQLEE